MRRSTTLTQALHESQVTTSTATADSVPQPLSRRSPLLDRRRQEGLTTSGTPRHPTTPASTLTSAHGRPQAAEAPAIRVRDQALHTSLDRSRFGPRDPHVAEAGPAAAWGCERSRTSTGGSVDKRVLTGCNNCKRYTNSGAAEFGRKQGKLWANVMTMGGVAAVQAFTVDCRSCGHKLSSHDRGSDHQGNSYAAPVVVQQTAPTPTPPAAVAPPLPPQIPAGWYPDPNGQPCSRWRDGLRWTDSTAPMT